MADSQRQQSRFEYKGVSLNQAVDNVPVDKLTIGTNVRPDQWGVLSLRPAIASLFTPTTNPVHSLKSFNANGLNYIFSGSGNQLSLNNSPIDSGYSGNPMNFAAYQPQEAVQPFLYVADSARYVKARASDGQLFTVGSGAPAGPPRSEIGAPLYKVVSDFDSASGWSSTGASGAVSTVARVPAGTTIQNILYDSGTTGWACVTFSTPSTLWLTKGARITLGGTETQVISEFHPAALAASTTLAALENDVFGNTTGPSCAVLATNTFVLERNALLLINTELVRVLSVAIGEDNSVSFRCSPKLTHGDGESVTTFATARMYLNNSHAAGEAVTGAALTSAMTLLPSATGKVNVSGTAVTYAAGSGDMFDTSGLWTGLIIVINYQNFVIATVNSSTSLTLTSSAGNSSGSGGWNYSVTPPSTGELTLTTTLDLSQISGRPMTPDDWMHISMAVDVPSNLSLIQILVDVDATTNDFQHNYYWAGITANVLQAAATANEDVLAAQQAAVAQQATQVQLQQLQQEIAALGNSQLATGQVAWTEIFIPLSQLLAGRVGTDESRTLANVKAIQILLSCTAPVNVTVDSWWIGGGYGPNCPESTFPDNGIEYCFRYRSTITGAQTTWSPLTRHGLFPERMPCLVSGAGSVDPQIDTVDIARRGASVDGTPLELASVPNTTTWTYTDNYADAQLEDPIEQVDFMPWPVQQKPITGTCGVTGTTLYGPSHAIPQNLCAGTLILINGAATTIRGLPLLNAGVLTVQLEDTFPPQINTPFQINSPTTYGNPLPYLAGPFDETFFAWGDPINPGRIYWANRGNPDGANTANFRDLTNSDEPGLGICTWNGYVVAMTGERFFAGTTTNDPDNPYAFSETSTGTGLLVPWAFDPGPVIFFVSRGGIMATDLGPASSLSKDDLYKYLPHEGIHGIDLNTYPAYQVGAHPARLTYTKSGWLYFDYPTNVGTWQTLAINTLNPGWWFDSYTPGVTIHEQGAIPGSLQVLVGCVDGSVEQYALNGADSGGPINCQVRTNAWTFGDFRMAKQFEDVFVDVDAPAGPVTVTLLGDNWTTTILTAVLSGPRNAQRPPIAQGVPYGAFEVNAALDFTWQGPAWLYGYEVSAVPVPLAVAEFSAQPTSHGLKGYQTVREVRPCVQGGPGGCIVSAQCEFGSFSLPFYLDGTVQKIYIPCPTNKGMLYSWSISGTPTVRVFKNDFEIVVKEWGSRGGFRVVRPWAETSTV